MLRRLKNVEAKAEAILINSTPEVDLSSSRVEVASVTYEGFEGESHSGLVRSSCVRVRNLYKEGTEIRNVRQISILSVEDMQQIADNMGLPDLQPEWVGANLLVSGIPRFSKIPPTTRLLFERGASLVVDLENSPCKYPGDIIERFHPGFGSKFAKAAPGLRGVTAWVERPGEIRAGDSIQVFIPPQEIYDIP